jgi:hypothetical protein
MPDNDWWRINKLTTSEIKMQLRPQSNSMIELSGFFQCPKLYPVGLHFRALQIEDLALTPKHCPPY